MISYRSYVRIVLPRLGPLVGIKFVEVFHVTELFKSHRKVHVLVGLLSIDMRTNLSYEAGFYEDLPFTSVIRLT